MLYPWYLWAHLSDRYSKVSTVLPYVIDTKSQDGLQNGHYVVKMKVFFLSGPYIYALHYFQKN